MQTIIKLFQDIRKEYQEAHDALSDIETEVPNVSTDPGFRQLENNFESIWKQIESEDRLIWVTLHEAKENRNPEQFLKEVGNKLKIILGCSYNLISSAQSLRGRKKETKEKCTFIIEKAKRIIALSAVEWAQAEAEAQIDEKKRKIDEKLRQIYDKTPSQRFA